MRSLSEERNNFGSSSSDYRNALVGSLSRNVGLLSLYAPDKDKKELKRDTGYEPKQVVIEEKGCPLADSEV